MREAVIKIEGMSCQHCVIQVKKALQTLNCMGDLEVDIGIATVHYDETQVKRQDIEAAIKAAGYEVKQEEP